MSDRGYLDFARLYRIHQSSAFFVTRARSNLEFHRLCSQAVDKSTGVLSDQIIQLKVLYSRQGYPEKIAACSLPRHRRQPATRLVLLTNNFTLSTRDIADLYRCRWQVELFFKWIKQHLRIKASVQHRTRPAAARCLCVDAGSAVRLKALTFPSISVSSLETKTSSSLLFCFFLIAN